MITAEDCLATFAVAALIGAPDAQKTVTAAVDRYLAPHEHFPLMTSAALSELLDAFADLQIDSGVADKIYADIKNRLEQISRASIGSKRRDVGGE